MATFQWMWNEWQIVYLYFSPVSFWRKIKGNIFFCGEIGWAIMGEKTQESVWGHLLGFLLTSGCFLRFYSFILESNKEDRDNKQISCKWRNGKRVYRKVRKSSTESTEGWWKKRLSDYAISRDTVMRWSFFEIFYWSRNCEILWTDRLTLSESKDLSTGEK